MNRFKKEVRKKGIQLESDYPWLPYEVSHNIYVEGVYVNASTAIVVEGTNVMNVKYVMTRSGELKCVWDDEEETFF